MAVNSELREIVRLLRRKAKESGTRLWESVAECLEASRSRRAIVNVSRINRYTKNGDVIVIPGKVLGAGKLDHSVIVAAFAFSKEAKDKVIKAKGACLSIQELIERNPKGSNVRIIK